MEQIDVKILDRDYRLAVSAEDKPQLLEAVRMVDEKMRAVRDTGRITGTDRIAVMAALQLAHELLGAGEAATADATEAAPATAEVIKRIRRMSAELDSEIARQESLF